jgi:hypothetical protein
MNNIFRGFVQALYIEVALVLYHSGRHITYFSIALIKIILQFDFINHLQLKIAVYAIKR